MITKTCKTCGREKPLSEFYKSSGCKDGTRGACKDCHIEKNKITDDNKRETRKDYMKGYAKQNRDRFRRTPEQQQRYNARRRQAYARDETYREGIKTKVKAYNAKNPDKKKDQHLREHFGISLTDYQEILAKQKGKCAICGSTTSKVKIAKYLYVDHDHNTGEIRGLLCNNCNFGIGQFKDDVNLLLKAVEYLEGDHTGKVVDMVQSKRRAGRSGKSF